MKVSMNQMVQWAPEILKTPRQLVNEGQAIIREFPNFMGKRRAVLVESQWGSVEVSGFVKAEYK